MPSSVASIASPRSTSSDNSSARRRSRVTVTPEHTQKRVRENQRRHRARQRDYVTSLEQKLADTERALTEARAEIAVLTATNTNSQNNQLTTLSITNSVNILESGPSSNKQSELAMFDDGGPQLQYLGSPDVVFLSDTLSPSFLIDMDSFQMSVPTPPMEELEPIGGPPPCCSDATTSLPPRNEFVDPECSTCKTKPPPDPSESTTLCAQAFVLISQQNFRNLDPQTIRLWLAQGLRRAQREGEGCRVENGALMRLLDYISGL